MIANELLAQLSVPKFTEVVQASPRKFREEMFRRVGIKVKGDAFSLSGRGGSKSDMQVQRFRECLVKGINPGEEALTELVRNYLFTKRPMLKDALDFLDVPNEDGLTDQDLDFVSTLESGRRKNLRQLLVTKYPAEDVDLYFAVMNIPSD